MRRTSRRRMLMVACLVVPLTACGNWISVTDAGQVGITVDAAGQPVLEVMTCSASTPLIDMSEGRKKSDPASKENVERGRWTARRPFSGVAQLALADPSSDWKMTKSPGALESDRLFIIGGGTVEDDNANLVGVSFHTADLAKLTPDKVRVNLTGKTVSQHTFAAYKCR
jgi:hypothetical protein